MRIDFVEIQNFRRLAAVRIGFSKKTTLLVGANNSGKTSAITALHCFLIDQHDFSVCDIPLSRWASIDELGKVFETAEKTEARTRWRELLPSLDVWLAVSENEIHHVSHLIPSLEWNPAEGIGVRLQLEPKKPDDLVEAYRKARQAARDMLDTRRPTEPGKSLAKEENTKANGKAKGTRRKVPLWPESLTDFLKRRMFSVLTVNAYLLDPAQKAAPMSGIAQPQKLSDDAEPLDGDPLKGLIQIDEVPAQRGFSDPSGKPENADTWDQDKKGRKQPLTTQLRAYYAKHLDPLKAPEAADINALQAIHTAQRVFDKRLKECFAAPLLELEKLGYPGVTNPRLIVSTSLKPVDGLKHDSAVQYDVAPRQDSSTVSPYLLPEQCNGLGYQNLVSMVFRLMSFRDDWMKVGKADRADDEAGTSFASRPPLHLVLLEEPEAHLHAQVQQVFIREAFNVLRRHSELGDKSPLSTQLVVSTHSSHIAHAVNFADMRYFRRYPPRSANETPTSTVVNLSEVFGAPDDTARFVSRYLQATHADLFFADGVILVEGAAERMLVPHFIRSHYEGSSTCYITILEVGGSHAQRLIPLLECLGLNTLIVTDIDAVKNVANHPKVRPEKGIGLVTGNNVLKTWYPGKDSLDVLIDFPESGKEKVYDDSFSIRVAYQTPVPRALTDNPSGLPPIPSTFEDSLVFENIGLFRQISGTGMLKKFRDAVVDGKDISAVSQALFDALQSGRKAEFALEMLYVEDPASIGVPEYIRNGLDWLENKLLVHRQEVLVSQKRSADVREENTT